MSFRTSSLVNQLKRYRQGADERERKKRFKRPRWGMTPEEFKARHDARHGRCLIGGHQMDPIGAKHSGNTPCLDHSHKTNRDRWIICSNHNTALGLFRDSPEDLQAAIVYPSHYPATRLALGFSQHWRVQYDLPLKY